MGGRLRKDKERVKKRAEVYVFFIRLRDGGKKEGKVGGEGRKEERNRGRG